MIVLPDAGPEAIALAEKMIKEDHPQAPPLRLDLIADLNAPNLLGLAPGDPAAALEKRLGAAEKAGEVWRWPALGVESVVLGGVARRIALHASAADPAMKIFVGEVLVGKEPLTQRAPHLRIREVVHVLGADGARGETDGNVTELGWKRGQTAVLYLTFDEKLQLEAIVLEQFNAQLWQAMKSLEANRQLWDLEPEEAAAQSERENIAFAQLPPELAAPDIARLRLIAGRSRAESSSSTTSPPAPPARRVAAPHGRRPRGDPAHRELHLSAAGEERRQLGGAQPQRGVRPRGRGARARPSAGRVRRVRQERELSLRPTQFGCLRQ